MIMFKEDWDRYPTAIVHTTTKNTTWLELAAKYKEMGIKNYYFHLALINPILADYSPHDPDLPEDIASIMLVECSINPWYALREVIQIPGKIPGAYNPIQANRGNIAAYWAMYNRVIVYLQQIRQTGKSLWGRALVTDFHHFRNKRGTHILYTKSDLRSQEILEYKKFRETLPEWAYVFDGREADNQIAFTTRARGNETKTYIPSGDPEGAKKVGRGTTPDFILSDETPFCSYCPESIASLNAAVTASFPIAIENGTFHGIAYTTTAGDLTTREGKFVYNNIKKKSAAFGEMMYDFQNVEALHGFIEATTGEIEPKVDISFNHLQLGYSNDWLKRVISRNPGTRSDIIRDHLNQWTSGSATNPISDKLLDIIKKSVTFPSIKKVDKYDIYYKLYIEEEDFKSRKVIVGIDTSNAVGKDNITLVGLDIETTETVMVATINNVNLIHFANFLVDLLCQYKNITLVPEDKFNWKTIQDQLFIVLPTKGIDPGRRIYSRIVDTADGKDSDKRTYEEFSSGYPSEAKYRQYRDRFGFPTNGPLRETLFSSVLNDATKASCRLVRDTEISDELSTLVERNGRIDHAAGGHDDHVLSWLLANWFMRHARNLEHYDIDPRMVMRKVDVEETDLDNATRRNLAKKERMKAELESLEGMLSNATSFMEKQYYQSRIKSMRRDVGETNSLDSESVGRRSEEARSLPSANRDLRSMRSGYFTGVRNAIFG